MKRACAMMAILAAILAARAGHAEALQATVESVQGEQVKIVPKPSTPLPGAGDRLEVLVNVADVGQAVVATVIVTRIQGNSIEAKVERATGQIKKGQEVRAAAADSSRSLPPPGVSDSKAWTGVFLREAYRDQALAAGLDHTFGVVVAGVLEDTPASRKGIQVGDLLLALDGREIVSWVALDRDLGHLRPGTVAKFEVVHGRERRLLDLKLDAAPKDAELERRLRAHAERGETWAQFQLAKLQSADSRTSVEKEQALDWLHRAADAGDPSSLVMLGQMYEQGRIVVHDYAAAARYYKRAAEAGDPEGQAALGGLYWIGEGVPQSDQDSLKWNRLAAEQGSARGEYSMGIIYESGRAVGGRDFAEASRWNLKAARQGYNSGLLALARAYDHGRGVTKDGAEAQRWYQILLENVRPEAEKDKNAHSQYVLGMLYVAGKGVPHDDAQAARWFRAAADGGNIPAEFELGKLYADGLGVPRDDQEAVRWFRKAAEKGNVAASNTLGWMYNKGRGVVQDNAEAARWYRKAADKGHPIAMNNLGQLYADGSGVPKNDTEAFRWYYRAAEQQDPKGQYYVGMMITLGRGVARDDAVAAQWVRLAADQGYANALNSLGDFYAAGRGLPRDVNEAIRWYRKAAAAGHDGARQSLRVLGQMP